MHEFFSTTSLPARLFLGIVAVAGVDRSAAAAATISADPVTRTATGRDYKARIEGDGCLASMTVAGREFLAPGVGVSRGAYFFRNGTLALGKIEQPDATTIVAAGNQAKATYRFTDEGVACTVVNESDQPTAYFLVLAKDLAGVIDPNGAALKPAVEKRLESARFVVGDSVLEISGLDRLWGPWSGPHQVCEAMLAPGQSREIKLTTGRLAPAERASVVGLVQPPASRPLTILAPLNYQVVQRETLDAGTVLISGIAAVDADVVEYQVRGVSEHGALPVGWQAAEFVPATGGFCVSTNLPAGGWYALDARAKHAGKVVAEATVERFGVGEVFVGAGQSNSTNCGQFTTKQTSGMVASFGGDEWQLADDPQLGVADRSTGGSFWPAFGDAMYQRYKVPIGVAATGFGGTSVSQWQPDGDLFPWMMTRVRQLGPRGFRALLWHQGENDVDMPADEYATKLKRTIAASRASAGWPIPWFVAQATYHNMTRPRSDPIRAAQATLWQEGIALVGPDTDELQEAYRDLDGKGIHFSPKGLKRHGEMWAECVAPFVDSELQLENKTSASPPRAEQWPEADVLFHRDPRWLGGDDAYSIDLDDGRVAWFFGDSFVEPKSPGVRPGSTMVRNTVGIQTGYDPTKAEFAAYWAHQGTKPTSLIPDDGDDYYWPGGGVKLGDKILLFLMRSQNAETGLHFKSTGWGAALIDNLDQPADKWKITMLSVAQNNFDLMAGSGGVLAEGDFVYAFSHAPRGIALARWPRDEAARGDLSATHWFDSGRQEWIAEKSLSGPPATLFTPGQTEFTVHRLASPDRYLQLQFMGFPRTPIACRTAEKLTGPWSPLTMLFAPAELLAGDPELLLYASKLHPEQQCDGVALTYATNSFGLARALRDNAIYYPRFARVRFPAPAQAR